MPAVKSGELPAAMLAKKLRHLWKFHADLFRCVRVRIDDERNAELDCLRNNRQGRVGLRFVQFSVPVAGGIDFHADAGFRNRGQRCRDLGQAACGGLPGRTLDDIKMRDDVAEAGLGEAADAVEVARVLFVHWQWAVVAPGVEPALRVEVVDGAEDVVEWVAGGLLGEVIFLAFDKIHFHAEQDFDFAPVLEAQVEDALDVIIQVAFGHADIGAVAVGQGIVIGKPNACKPSSMARSM